MTLGIVEASVTEDLPNGSAPLAWANLCRKYEPAMRMSAVALNKQFAVCKLEDTETDPETWIQELEHLRGRIRDASPQNAVTDERMIAHILANLPEEYSELITTVESELDRPGENFGFDELMSRLRGFYRRKFEDKKEGKDEVALAVGYFKGICKSCGKRGHKAADCPDRKVGVGGGRSGWKKGGGRFPGKCFYCGKAGHRKADCWKKQADEKKRGEGERVDLVLRATDQSDKASEVGESTLEYALRMVANKDDFFICDSGATAHMTYNASRLHDVRETDRSVKVGNGATMKASSIGKMKAIVRNEEGEEMTTTINEVVHIPGLLCNLLSVGKLCEHGSVVYNKTGAKLQLSDKKGKTIPFSKVEGMEVFSLELRRDEVAHVVLPREKPVPAKKAHEILGHVENDVTRKTMNYWGWKVSRGSHFCESCAIAKAKQKNVVKVRKDKGAEKQGERL